jgi:membrane protein required for colicin V production
VNRIDAVLLVLLLPFAFRGYSRGFLREGLGIAGVIGGALAASAGWEQLGATMAARGWFSPMAASVVAVALLFVSTYVLAQLLGIGLDHALRSMRLGGINRFAGVAFGIAKGGAILGLGLLVLVRFAPPTLQERVRASALGEPLIRLATFVLDASRQAIPPAPPERQHI